MNLPDMDIWRRAECWRFILPLDLDRLSIETAAKDLNRAPELFLRHDKLIV